MDARRSSLLDTIGVTAYVPRGRPPGPMEAPPGVVQGPAGMDWSQLAATVRECTLCGLCATRTQTVFGTGNIRARLMVIGEAPGAEEDRQGEPFVGRAGGLLNSMLRAAGFERPQVYIANVLKCRPPNNRDPATEETDRCLPYLRRQIELIDPAAILCVGRIAAQRLLERDDSLARLRGHVHRLGRTPVIVTYHPAYLLRNLPDKAKAWADLRFAVRTLAGS